MRDEHTVICSPAVFELIAPDAPVVPVNVDLTYNSRDPYAVQASFRTGHGTAVDWVFARDLLQEGLVGSAGTGDVRVQPAPGNPGKVQLELSSPSGHAVFITCAQTLGDFLRRTYEAVPPNSEYDWLDFDLALADLLNDPARD
ncbi:Streptomyces sporulation and cell division protein, SsgA [Pseudonocardia thermophila]|jgi:Streptomyces sporulation and cell division protein, SsgA.|uniref:Streptomyces sporulation and cell division protein, SsgA n=1 Tax=Pseudonocardia thermophila TaxID=1848 RepID=A0A1M6R0F5_PSETH|nr:SsgA family sporulation/cell division regulator [Pseudonocardia thermophila]SHK26009.1 Streptomyces sporulation and cell division protein, SsgA [Pseudonocardia thermophila]